MRPSAVASGTTSSWTQQHPAEVPTQWLGMLQDRHGRAENHPVRTARVSCLCIGCSLEPMLHPYLSLEWRGQLSSSGACLNKKWRCVLGKQTWRREFSYSKILWCKSLLRFMMCQIVCQTFGGVRSVMYNPHLQETAPEDSHPGACRTYDTSLKRTLRMR